MHPVEIEKRNTIAPLFEGIQDSMVIACLQGIMGQAYVARETEPKAALIVSGEYSFFGGDPTSPDARELVQNLFQVNESDRTVVIFNDQLLQRYMDAIPEGYQLAPFDEDLYHQAMAEDWSREFCEVFPSAEEYLNKGFGFEIQVATRES